MIEELDVVAGLSDLLMPAPEAPPAFKRTAGQQSIETLLGTLSRADGPTARQLLAIYLVRRRRLKFKDAAAMMKVRLQSVAMLVRRGERRLRAMVDSLRRMSRKPGVEAVGKPPGRSSRDRP